MSEFGKQLKAIEKQIELSKLIKLDFPNLGEDFIEGRFLTCKEADSIYGISNFYKETRQKYIETGINLALRDFTFRGINYRGLIRPEHYKKASLQAKSHHSLDKYHKGIGISSMQLEDRKIASQKGAQTTNKLKGHINWNQKIKTSKFGLIELNSYIYLLSLNKKYQDSRNRLNTKIIQTHLNSKFQIKILNQTQISKTLMRYKKNLEFYLINF